MAEERSQPTYFTVIPAPVRYDTRLPAMAKLIYGEITALTNKDGYCWASNEYIADQFMCTERTVSRSVAALEELGYIRQEMATVAGKKGNRERRIYNCMAPDSGIDKNVSTESFVYTGVDKNVYTHINSMNNNRMNNNPLTPLQGEASGKKKKDPAKPAWKPERFEGFYDFYRRKVMPKGRYPSRVDAAKQWDKLKPDDETIEAIGKALRTQMQSEDWKRGIGIPDPCRYLSHRRWEDVDTSAMTASCDGREEGDEDGI